MFNLSFDRHIDLVVTKASSMLGFLKRLCWNFYSLDALKAVYFSLVRSHLEYASIIWCPYYSVHSNRIESIQKQFILFALRRRYPSHLYSSLPSYLFRCDILKVPSLSVRRYLFHVSFVYDILSGRIDASNILSKLTFAIPSRRLRNQNYLFKIPFMRTNFELSNPIIVMLTLCNAISSDIDFSLNRNSFMIITKQALQAMHNT